MAGTSGSVLWAQRQAASIVGAASDPDGNAISEATVSLSIPALQLMKLRTTTDSPCAHKFPNQQLRAQSRGHNRQNGVVQSVQGIGDKHIECENC